MALLITLALALGAGHESGEAVAAPLDPADLSVTITDSPDPVATGATLTYTIRVRNSGPDPATGTTLTVSLPSGVTFVSATPSAGACDRSGTKVTCDFGTLNDEVERTVTIRTTVKRKSGEMTASASVSSQIDDPSPGNNLDTELTRISNPEPVKCDGRDVTILGTDGPDVLFGTPADDVIVADEGDDLVFALLGGDYICAGPGTDVIRAGPGADAVFGGLGPDFIQGRKGDDAIHGGRGRDRLRGMRGDDFLHGDDGFDRCLGGFGRDRFGSCELARR